MFRKFGLLAAMLGLLLIPLAVTAQEATSTPEPTVDFLTPTNTDITPDPSLEGTTEMTPTDVTAEMTSEATTEATLDTMPAMSATPTSMDATPMEPTPTDMAGDGNIDVEVLRGVTIQEIVNDPVGYVDQVVEIEGDITAFVNSRIFVLSEDAAIASDGVLVINSTGEHLAPWVVTGRHYQLSGRVRYSINDAGGVEAVRQNAMDELELEPVPESFDTVLLASILEGYEDYEIIEVTDVDNVKGFATLEQITANDLRYIGYDFFVVGRVGEFVTSNAFLLTEDALLDEDRVVVINAGMAPVSEGQRVKVYGKLARFTDFRDDPDSGVDLTDEAFLNYETYNVLRAELVEVIE